MLDHGGGGGDGLRRGGRQLRVVVLQQLGLGHGVLKIEQAVSCQG